MFVLSDENHDSWKLEDSIMISSDGESDGDDVDGDGKLSLEIEKKSFVLVLGKAGDGAIFREIGRFGCAQAFLVWEQINWLGRLLMDKSKDLGFRSKSSFRWKKSRLDVEEHCNRDGIFLMIRVCFSSFRKLICLPSGPERSGWCEMGKMLLRVCGSRRGGSVKVMEEKLMELDVNLERIKKGPITSNGNHLTFLEMPRNIDWHVGNLQIFLSEFLDVLPKLCVSDNLLRWKFNDADGEQYLVLGFDSTMRISSGEFPPLPSNTVTSVISDMNPQLSGGVLVPSGFEDYSHGVSSGSCCSGGVDGVDSTLLSSQHGKFGDSVSGNLDHDLAGDWMDTVDPRGMAEKADFDFGAVEDSCLTSNFEFDLRSQDKGTDMGTASNNSTDEVSTLHMRNVEPVMFDFTAGHHVEPEISIAGRQVEHENLVFANQVEKKKYDFVSSDFEAAGGDIVQAGQLEDFKSNADVFCGPGSATDVSPVSDLAGPKRFQPKFLAFLNALGPPNSKKGWARPKPGFVEYLKAIRNTEALFKSNKVMRDNKKWGGNSFSIEDEDIMMVNDRSLLGKTKVPLPLSSDGSTDNGVKEVFRPSGGKVGCWFCFPPFLPEAGFVPFNRDLDYVSDGNMSFRNGLSPMMKLVEASLCGVRKGISGFCIPMEGLLWISGVIGEALEDNSSISGITRKWKKEDKWIKCIDGADSNDRSLIFLVGKGKLHQSYKVRQGMDGCSWDYLRRFLEFKCSQSGAKEDGWSISRGCAEQSEDPTARVEVNREAVKGFAKELDKGVVQVGLGIMGLKRGWLK